MTIKVQIQTPEQETPYLLTARSWESPEGKDHLIYPAHCHFFFFQRHLLVPGRTRVAGQTDIVCDLGKEVTIFYHSMSIGLASSRLWIASVELVHWREARRLPSILYHRLDQFLQWHLFMKTAKSAVRGLKRKKIFLSPSMDMGIGMNFGMCGISVWVSRCWDAAHQMLLCVDVTQGLLTSLRCTSTRRLGFSVWQHLLIVQLGITY